MKLGNRLKLAESARSPASIIIINDGSETKANGGRTIALESLAEDGVALNGVEVTGAFLFDMKLLGAELYRANFQGADLYRSNFSSRLPEPNPWQCDLWILNEILAPITSLFGSCKSEDELDPNAIADRILLAIALLKSINN